MTRNDVVSFNAQEMSLSDFVDSLQLPIQQGLVYFDNIVITKAYIYHPTCQINQYDDFAVLVFRVKNPPSKEATASLVEARDLSWARSLIKQVKTKDNE